MSARAHAIRDGRPGPAPRAGHGIGLRGRTISAVAWGVAGRAVQQGGGLITSIALARLLLPEAFGLVAMAAVFTNFAAVIVDSGFGDAIIQREAVDDARVNSIFLLGLALGGGATALFLLVAPALARFYAAPDLAAIVRLLAPNFAITALGIVPRALLRKEMRFRPLAMIDTAATVVAGTVAIGLAAAGAGVRSLPAATAVGTILTTAALWATHPWRPRLAYSRAAVRDASGFGSGLLGFNLVNYWARNLDNLIVGRMLGPAALGVYARAYFLMLLPIDQVTGVVGAAMFPALSSIQHDRARVKGIFLRALGVIALVCAPAVAGLFVVAGSLIPAVYGERWGEVVPLFRVLCVAGALQTLCNPVGWIYTSQGRTDLLCRWGLWGSGTMVASIAIGGWFGSLASIAWAYVIATALLFYPCLAIPGRLIGMTVLEVVREVSASFGCALVMALLVHRVGLALAGSPPWPVLGAQVFSGIVIYISMIHVLNLRAYVDLKQCIANKGGPR